MIFNFDVCHLINHYFEMFILLYANIYLKKLNLRYDIRRNFL